MTIREAIRAMLKENGKTQVWLAEKMGYAHQGAISSMLMRGRVKFETLYALCEAFDYEITVQPKKKAGRRPDGQIVLEVKE